MSEKYIELKPQIVSDYALVGATAVQGGVGIALEWLDRHPDQVPGRKKFPIERVEITDTEAYELYQSAKSFSLEDFKLALESIDGIETVDDPEPTNAEKLEKIIWASGGPVASISLTRAELLAKWLDEAGVKAPGGDDDH